MIFFHGVPIISLEVTLGFIGKKLCPLKSHTFRLWLFLQAHVSVSSLLSYICKLGGSTFIKYVVLRSFGTWYVCFLYQKPEYGWKTHFFIYAVHQIMALFLNKMGNLFLGNSMYIGGIMFLIIPVIVTVFSYCVEKILSKYCPVIWKILSGGR